MTKQINTRIYRTDYPGISKDDWLREYNFLAEKVLNSEELAFLRRSTGKQIMPDVTYCDEFIRFIFDVPDHVEHAYAQQFPSDPVVYYLKHNTISPVQSFPSIIIDETKKTVSFGN